MREKSPTPTICDIVPRKSHSIPFAYVGKYFRVEPSPFEFCGKLNGRTRICETIKNIPLENVFFPSANRIEIERINVFYKVMFIKL